METLVTVPSDYELERGKPMPSKLHGFTQSKLITQLNLVSGERYDVFSELSLLLEDWPSVPDIALFPQTEIDYLYDEITVQDSPLLVVEIMSPSQGFSELVAKAKKYFEAGVKSCWLAIPNVRNVYVFSSPTDYAIFRDHEELRDSVLDISIPLREVFR